MSLKEEYEKLKDKERKNKIYERLLKTAPNTISAPTANNSDRISRVSGSSTSINNNNDRINRIAETNSRLNKFQDTTRTQIQEQAAPTTFLKNPSTATVQNNSSKNIISDVLPIATDLIIRKKYGDTIANVVGDTKNIIENTGLGVQNGLLHFGKQINDLNLRTQEREQKLFNKANQDLIEKIHGVQIDPTSTYSSSLQQKIIDNLNEKNQNISNVQNKNLEKIQANIESSTNPISRKVAELAPSIGQMLPGFIPGAGPVYFAGSAASQYTDEGLQRGMTKDEARNYGGVMGLVEGATETLGAWLTKGVGKALAKGNISKALKTYGLDIAENFAEEAIIEPISEVTATITGGKDTADFSNMSNRMLQSGIDGALISIITGGASAGIGSAINVVQKMNSNIPVTNAEIQQAVSDTQASGKVDVENEIRSSISAVKDDFITQQDKKLPVINEKSRVNKAITRPVTTTIEKAPIANVAPSELMRGINKITENNLELDVDNLPTARAKIEGNKVTIDDKSGRLEDIIHEVSHYSENNSKGYEVLKNHVLTELQKQEDFEQIRNNVKELYTNQYAKEGRTFTENDLEKELVAKYTEKFIGDEIFVNKIVNADKSTAQRIFEWIKNKINYYKKIAKMEPEQRLEYENLRKAEKLWEEALKGVNGQNENITAKIINKTKENMKDNSNIKLESISKIKSLITGGGFRTPEQINELKESIMQNGIRRPVELIKNEKGKIILKDGNHRILIAKELGLKEIPVTYLSPGIENIEDIEKYNEMLYNEKDKKVFEGEYVNGRINRTSKEVNSNIKGSKDTKRSDNSNSDGNENRRATNEDDKIYRGQQTNNYGTSSVTTRIENNKWRKIKSRGSDKETFSAQKKVNNAAPTVEKFETVYGENNRQYQRQLIRAFKDISGNEFRLYKLPNNHSELQIKEKGQNSSKTIRASQAKILQEIQKYWEGTGTFIDIDISGTQNTAPTAKDKQAPRYSIAGTIGMKNAIKYDASNIALESLYNQAQQMQKNGVDNETIRKQTDWFQDKNGDWKFEFTDKHMSIKNIKNLKKNSTYKLGDVLKHDTLFMVYPQLKNYEVKISDMDSNGSFNKKYGRIRLNNELTKNEQELEGTLIHEIQHAIQDIEGFEPGKSSKKSKLAYLNSLGEIEAAETKNRYYLEKYYNKKLNNIAPESSKSNPKHLELENYMKNRGIVDKIKDGVYNYFDKRGISYEENFEENFDKNQENISENRSEYNRLVDGRGRLTNEGKNNQSDEQNEIDGNVRKFYENVRTSRVISDEIKKSLKPQTYRKLTNDESMVTAIARLNNNPEEESKWRKRDITKTNSVDVAEGLALLAKYQHERKYESALEVIDRLAEIGTKGGQQVQMFALLQRLTPEGMLNYAQKSLKKVYDMEKQYHNKEWENKHKEEYKLTKEDAEFITERMEKVVGMEDGRDKQVLLAEIQKLISDKLPPDRGASIKAYMRISMLFNSKTQIRNILGNALISPVNMVADTFATAVDKSIAKKTGVRTKGLTDVKAVAEGTVTGIYKSIDDFKRGIDTRSIEGDRFEVGKGIRGANFSNKTRLGRAMNSLDRTLSFMLDMGDRPFYESAFLNSINNQMKLNNVTTPTPEMIEIATKEGLQRTWQDNNAYTTFVLNLRDGLNLKFESKKYGISTKGFRYGLGDILIPFAKTPANLTKAIVDYSPIGFFMHLVKDAKQLSNSISKNQDVQKYQHQFVDNLGKGFAGSLIYILGSVLANAGIATGENDEDKDVANFMKNTLGIQPYSIKIGNQSFTYDWAQPVAAPIAIMSNYVKYSKDNPDATALTKALKASIIGSEQLFEQSFMTSINNILNGYNESIFENILDEALALPARGVPTLLKQIADMIDGTQRTSFDKTDKLATAGNKVIAKLPVASQILAPSVDTMGREIQKYGGDNNAFNVFFNPANTNKGQLTESAEEIYNLYKETGDKTIFPIQAPYSVTMGEETTALDAYTRADYQKTTGQYSDSAIKKLVSNIDYKNLSNEEKIKVLKNVVGDSNLTAKKEVLDYVTDEETQKEKSIQTGISLPNMYIYSNIINRMESKKDSNGDTIIGSKQASMAQYIMAMRTTEAQKNKMLAEISEAERKVTVDDLETVGLKNYTQFLSISNADSKDKYKRLASTGMNTNQLNKYWNEINDVEGEKGKNGKTISGTKKKAVREYINSLNLSIGEKLLLYASTNDDYKLTYSEKTQLFSYIKSIKGMTDEEKQGLVNSLKCFK